FFSVVIPTFNRPQRLLRCLSGLSALEFPRDRFEVIVANNGWMAASPEEIAQAGEGLRMNFISLPNVGPAAARNAAVRLARGKYLAFLDDDSAAHRRWLAEFDNAFESSPDALLGGHTLNALQSNVYSEASQTLIDYLYGYYGGRAAGREQFFASNNMAVRADAFRALGGFDETFRRAAEDREFCERWRASGRPFVFVASAIVHHAHELDAGSFLAQHFTYGRGAFIFRRRCAQRSARRVRVEPPGFYTSMMRFPWQRGVKRAPKISALLATSQLANAIGFFFEAGASFLARDRRPSEGGQTESEDPMDSEARQQV
ncbi:MAG: glycosyltransferase, partial [Gemmatimonadota bacterium]|nr:glycosyltransferase [Gemmatimonadota bacterium]